MTSNMSCKRKGESMTLYNIILKITPAAIFLA